MIELSDFQTLIKGTPLLSPLSIKIEAGKFCVLTAASGAGKTRLLETLSQPHLEHQGSVRISGSCATIPQSLDFCPALGAIETVCTSRLETLRWYQSLIGFPKNLKIEAKEALEFFGFTPDKDKPVGLLSGGERQRIALARLVLSQRRNWLLDEPVSQLDPESAIACLSRVKSIARERGVAVICVLHHPEWAESLADLRLDWSSKWRIR